MVRIQGMVRDVTPGWIKALGGAAQGARGYLQQTRENEADAEARAKRERDQTLHGLAVERMKQSLQLTAEEAKRSQEEWASEQQRLAQEQKEGMTRFGWEQEDYRLRQRDLARAEQERTAELALNTGDVTALRRAFPNMNALGPEITAMYERLQGEIAVLSPEEGQRRIAQLTDMLTKAEGLRQREAISDRIAQSIQTGYWKEMAANLGKFAGGIDTDANGTKDVADEKGLEAIANGMLARLTGNDPTADPWEIEQEFEKLIQAVTEQHSRLEHRQTTYATLLNKLQTAEAENATLYTVNARPIDQMSPKARAEAMYALEAYRRGELGDSITSEYDLVARLDALLKNKRVVNNPELGRLEVDYDRWDKMSPAQQDMLLGVKSRVEMLADDADKALRDAYSDATNIIKNLGDRQLRTLKPEQVEALTERVMARVYNNKARMRAKLASSPEERDLWLSSLQDVPVDPEVPQEWTAKDKSGVVETFDWSKHPAITSGASWERLRLIDKIHNEFKVIEATNRPRSEHEYRLVVEAAAAKYGISAKSLENKDLVLALMMGTDYVPEKGGK